MLLLCINILIENFKFNNLIKYMKILAIQNFGTSGTTLMHSYLDGHPQVLSLPGLFGYEAYKLWFSKYSNLTHDNIISEHLNDFIYFLTIQIENEDFSENLQMKLKFVDSSSESLSRSGDLCVENQRFILFQNSNQSFIKVQIEKTNSIEYEVTF